MPGLHFSCTDDVTCACLYPSTLDEPRPSRVTIVCLAIPALRRYISQQHASFPPRSLSTPPVFLATLLPLQMNINFFETPTGWKFFGNLMDSKELGGQVRTDFCWRNCFCGHCFSPGVNVNRYNLAVLCHVDGSRFGDRASVTQWPNPNALLLSINVREPYSRLKLACSLLRTSPPSSLHGHSVDQLAVEYGRRPAACHHEGVCPTRPYTPHALSRTTPR